MSPALTRLLPAAAAWVLVTLMLVTAAPELPTRPVAATVALASGALVLSSAATGRPLGLDVPAWAPAVGAVGLSALVRFDPRGDHRMVLMSLAALGPPAVLSLATRWDRPVSLAAFSTGFIGLARLLVYDPFYDASCTHGCVPTDPWLGQHPPVADGFAVAANAAILVVGLAAIFRARSSLPRQLLVVAVLVEPILRIASSPAAGVEVTPDAGQVALGVAGVVVGGGVLVQLLRLVRERSRVRSLVDSIEAADDPDQLERGLRQLLGDDSLRLAISTDRGNVLLDGSPAPRSLEVLSHLTMDSATVAVLLSSHPRGGVDRLPTRARLGVLTHVLEHRLHDDVTELRNARTSMVKAAARTRRALERDLHDGAQQQILFAVGSLRAAERRGERLVHNELTARATEARERVETALLDVRAVANSVHPHALTAGGLEAALGSLSDTSQAPVRRRVHLNQPLSPEVEHCLYTTIADVTSRSAEVRDVDLASANGNVSAVVRGQGLTLAAHLSDTVAALGGTVSSDSSRIEVSLPCGP